MLLAPARPFRLALLGRPIWPPIPKNQSTRRTRARRRVRNDERTRRSALVLGLVPPTLVCSTQELCLEGELVIAEPTTLRYRLWHTAGRLVRHGRRLVLCLQGTWPLDASAGGGVRAAAIPCPHAADHPRGWLHARPGRQGPDRHDVVVNFDRFLCVACSTSHANRNWCFRMIVLSRGVS